MRMVGRNQNSNDEAAVTTVEINSLTATLIASANSERIFLGISLDQGFTDIEAFIRLFPAADNDDAVGIILVRHTLGNQNLFTPYWQMPPDNIYTGEVSAIATLGTFNVHVMEY